ncbi:hypothetical protein PsorP6_012241 [Peronosclerospora sorghi]|uniref:Uncharacterized protein n=1 Tax=Peronosclerospora sorghi TaxID=230839 RepID=A0ACC0WJS0_9STRA|nr:hypothetical protein PsorP6_012241 [Peronosclerospora sorghi]
MNQHLYGHFVLYKARMVERCPSILVLVIHIYLTLFRLKYFMKGKVNVNWTVETLDEPTSIFDTIDHTVFTRHGRELGFNLFLYLLSC